MQGLRAVLVAVVILAGSASSADAGVVVANGTTVTIKGTNAADHMGVIDSCLPSTPVPTQNMTVARCGLLISDATPIGGGGCEASGTGTFCEDRIRTTTNNGSSSSDKPTHTWKTVIIDLGDGADTLTYKAPEAATIKLGIGADTFTTDERQNTVSHIGKLTVDAGGGNDNITGGPLTDRLDCGSGTDSISYKGHPAGVLIRNDGKNNDGAPTEHDNVLACENMTGSELNDTIYGDDRANVINPLFGADHVYAGDGADKIQVPDGDLKGDYVDAGPGYDRVLGGQGNDTLIGGPGGDDLDGWVGADTVDGGPGGDHLEFYTKGREPRGSSKVCDPLGCSTVQDDRAQDVYRGGADYDTLDLSRQGEDDSTLPVTSVMILNGKRDKDEATDVGAVEQLYTGKFDDRITTFPGADTFVDTGAGADVITAHAGDRVRGGADIDTLDLSTVAVAFRLDLGAASATLGSGKLEYGGFENLVGGKGNDILNGTFAANTISGGTGNDTINGGSGDDVLSDGPGDDKVEGGAGKDTLNDGTGNDRQGGGPDDDLLKVGVLFGSIGANTFLGGTGRDTLDVVDTAVGAVFSLDNVANDGVAAAVGRPGGGISNLQSNAASDIERIDGTDAADRLAAPTTKTGVPRELVGRGGNDRLTAGGDSATLDGGAGTDTLTGGGGADTLLDDAAGNFVIAAGGGLDILTFSSTGPLLLTLDGSANDGVGGATGNLAPDVETIKSGTGNDKITGSAAPDIVYGGGGNDVIDGGGGDDQLFGEFGNDELTGGPGRDVLNGGSNDDRLHADDGQTGETVDCGGNDDAAGYDAGDTVTGCESLL